MNETAIIINNMFSMVYQIKNLIIYTDYCHVVNYFANNIAMDLASISGLPNNSSTLQFLFENSNRELSITTN